MCNDALRTIEQNAKNRRKREEAKTSSAARQHRTCSKWKLKAKAKHKSQNDERRRQQRKTNEKQSLSLSCVNECDKWMNDEAPHEHSPYTRSHRIMSHFAQHITFHVTFRLQCANCAPYRILVRHTLALTNWEIEIFSTFFFVGFNDSPFFIPTIWGLFLSFFSRLEFADQYATQRRVFDILCMQIVVSSIWRWPRNDICLLLQWITIMTCSITFLRFMANEMEIFTKTSPWQFTSGLGRWWWIYE